MESGLDLDQVMLQSLNKKDLAERITAAKALETWTTDDGRTRELYALPALNTSGSESGLQIVIVTEDNTGERTAQLAGSIAGVDPTTTELSELSWTDGTTAALSFVKEDGGELTVEILTTAAKRCIGSENRCRQGQSGADSGDEQSGERPTNAARI